MYYMNVAQHTFDSFHISEYNDKFSQLMRVHVDTITRIILTTGSCYGRPMNFYYDCDEITFWFEMVPLPVTFSSRRHFASLLFA